MVSLDLLFIAVFSVHEIYTVLYSETRLLGREWHIGRDGSYAERFGYLKMAAIVSVLILIRGKRRRPIYLAWILIFTAALLDDAWELHERVGHALADSLALQAFAGWMSPRLG